MWHANGTTGEERLGAGGEVEALRPPARSPLFAGASNRHHPPTGGAPGAALPPGSLRGARPGPGRHSRFYAGSQEDRRLPYRPERGNGGWPERLGTSSSSGFCPRACFPRIAPATCANDVPLETAPNRPDPMGGGPNVDQGLGCVARPDPVRSADASRTLVLGDQVADRPGGTAGPITLPVARREFYPG
jgi:hypothetical protein